MSVNVATDIASHKAKAMFFGREDAAGKSQLNARIGHEVAKTLSDMKGPLMKVGQIFAQIKDLFPPEVSQALGQLRQHATPVDAEVIRQQIIQGLGQAPEEIFAWFDIVPYRAASLGQVHKATLKSGEQVVVKVQYPDVASACASDMKHLKNLFRLLPLMGIDSQSLHLIFLEIEEVIHRELDYCAEAAAMQEFYDFFKDSDRVVVPQAFLEYSSSTILTMTFEQGTSLESVQQVRAQGRGDPEFIQNLSENLFFCLLEQIFVLKKIHVDPHAGNFAVRPDGRIIIFDFGAVKALTDDAVSIFKALVKSMLAYDFTQIESLLFEKGIRRPNSPPLHEDFYRPWLDLLTPPFMLDKFDFEHSNIHSQALVLAKTNWKKHQAYFLPSRDTLLLDRVIAGHYWNLMHLRSHFSLKTMLMPYL